MKIWLNEDSQKSIKKLLEERDKIISSLKKHLKIYVASHPQIEELLALQEQVNSLEKGTLDLKEKILHLKNEKQSFQKEKELILKVVSTEHPQQTTTHELTKAMSQVSLKDDEIKILTLMVKSFWKFLLLIISNGY